MTEDQQRFREIIGEIDNLMCEAISIIPESLVERSKSYWYSHIMCALNDDNEFIGRSMCNMQDTLEDWQEITDESQSQEDWDDCAGRPAHMRDEDRD